ncbi:MAG TPA: 50S ribosomal protein L29 [Candidatus Kapabacteria bacterium]|nr:50S ribosomal protein L29 [Candidatus Kapabacteria bacterium]HYM34255.1 50S ribosomal protein L29 [Steroidobacteraceae bacterium]
MKASKSNELRGRDIGELKRQIAENNARLIALNFQKVTGHLDNNAQITTLRRDTARINTILRERALKSAAK